MPSKKTMPRKNRAKTAKEPKETEPVKLQRPFYKGSAYKSNAPVDSTLQKRFVHWVCLPGHECEPEQQVPENVYWRIFRIMAEFIEGFEFLSKLQREVTFFGSARTTPDSPYYKVAVQLGRLCAKGGYTVITGGGPGIMEAGNKGAREGKGESIGLDIELPTEQRRNDYVTRAIGFHYFFTRKVMLSASAQAYVFFPGGFGTLDESTEMLCLVQTGKIPRSVPCIFVGKKFWQPLLDWIKGTLLEEKYIKSQDMDLIKLVDTAQEAYDLIRRTEERGL